MDPENPALAGIGAASARSSTAARTTYERGLIMNTPQASPKMNEEDDRGVAPVTTSLF
jgi:hypothetical protein